MTNAQEILEQMELGTAQRLYAQRTDTTKVTELPILELEAWYEEQEQIDVALVFSRSKDVDAYDDYIRTSDYYTRYETGEEWQDLLNEEETAKMLELIQQAQILGLL